MLAKIYTVRFRTVAFALNQSMGMSQAHFVLAATMNYRRRALVGGVDVADTILFEAVQPAPECTYTGQSDQQRLINLDQGDICTGTLLLSAYIIARRRIQGTRSP